MITKLLHTRTKIFFSNPYVVRIEYKDNQSESDIRTDYRKITRNAYKLITGTWGYSELEHEFITPRSPNPALLAGSNGTSMNQVLWALSDDSIFVYRGYFCFKDELDALQFRLTIDTRAIQVKMWPTLWFTIHEIVEIDES